MRVRITRRHGGRVIIETMTGRVSGAGRRLWLAALWVDRRRAGRPAPRPRGASSTPTRIDAAARTLPRLHSLLVSRRGELVFERYYNGTRRDRPANIKSASKSVISALVGIAIDRTLIPDVKTPIVTYFPELAQRPRRAQARRSPSSIC